VTVSEPAVRRFNTEIPEDLLDAINTVAPRAIGIPLERFPHMEPADRRRRMNRIRAALPSLVQDEELREALGVMERSIESVTPS
jgi:hypothetical protein